MNRTMNISRALVLFTALAAVVLVGCQPLTQAQTMEERLLYAYASQTGILNAAAAGLDAGALTADEGEFVIEQAREARRHLDVARQALTLGRTASAEDRMSMAISLLLAAQQRLDGVEP